MCTSWICAADVCTVYILKHQFILGVFLWNFVFSFSLRIYFPLNRRKIYTGIAQSARRYTNSAVKVLSTQQLLQKEGARERAKWKCIYFVVIFMTQLCESAFIINANIQPPTSTHTNETRTQKRFRRLHSHTWFSMIPGDRRAHTSCCLTPHLKFTNGKVFPFVKMLILLSFFVRLHMFAVGEIKVIPFELKSMNN